MAMNTYKLSKGENTGIFTWLEKFLRIDQTMAEVIQDQKWPDFTRRRALLCRLAQLETGEPTPSVQTLERLAGYLGRRLLARLDQDFPEAKWQRLVVGVEETPGQRGVYDYERD